MSLIPTRLACITVMLLGCSEMRDDSMQHKLSPLSVKITLNPPLQDSEPPQEELAQTVRSIQRQLREDAKNESLTSEQSERTYCTAVEQLTRLAQKSPTTTAALTAKLLCAELIPYCGVQGADKDAEGHELRETALRLMGEICREHGGTWQAAVCPLLLANLELQDQIQSVPPMQRSERERLARPAHIQRIEKALADLPAKLVVVDRAVMEWLYLDPTASDPIRAQLLIALANSQYNHATAINQSPDIRLKFLKQARARYQTLATEFPESMYAAQCRHIITVMIDPELK